jgi:PadR family transcriptional regulator PadR
MAGSDLYTGTLDVLVLKALTNGPLHGYAIGLWIRRTSAEVLSVQEGVLYPALHRLEKRGWVSAKWGTTETNRRARFYKLTQRGRKHLQAEVVRLTEHSEAVLSVLKALG